MEDYNIKSRSIKSTKEPVDKKIEKVVTGTVATKKKSRIKKFADIFIAEDNPLSDVFISAIKKALSDIATSGMDAIADITRNGLDIALWGEAGHTKRRGKSSHISYNSLYERDEPSRASYGSRSVYDYDDIIIYSRKEAEEVLASLDDLIAEYRLATVADLYSLIGKTGSHTDCRYGWTDLRAAKVVPYHGGYTLKLPKAMPIE